MKLRYYFTIAKLTFILLTPIVLLILPADYFDNGSVVCLSRLIFNMECFACGLTRACMHLIHLEFAQAASYNKLCFIVLPLAMVLAVQWFLKEWKSFKKYRVTLPASQAS